MIYFIQGVQGGLIKIGTTVRLSERLKQLSVDQGCDLRVLAVLDGSYTEEKAIHRRFAHLRVRNEYFDPSEELLSFIAEKGREWDGLDESPRSPLFSVKGRKEWHGWLQNLAKFDRSSVVEMLDRAVARYAQEIGYDKPSPER